MQSLFTYVSPPGSCHYLPAQTASIEYELVANLSAAEYLQRMLDGWRRFGAMLFRPRCPNCQACMALRVDVAKFAETRSQRRVRKLNESAVKLSIGRPALTRAKLDLYDRYHAFQTSSKGWPELTP